MLGLLDLIDLLKSSIKKAKLIKPAIKDSVKSIRQSYIESCIRQK